MRLPIQSEQISYNYQLGQAKHEGIRASLPPRPGAGSPSCSCISHGDSTLTECCKIGTDECRSCVGETTGVCCNNLKAGKPSPVPVPAMFFAF